LASRRTHQVEEGTLVLAFRASLAKSAPSLQSARKTAAMLSTGGSRPGQGHCCPALM